MKWNSVALVALVPVTTLVTLPSPWALPRLIDPAHPLRAQASEDWSTAPIAIPSAPSGGVIMPADPAGDASIPPRREIQLPPQELRRPEVPLLPGEAPSIRVAPGEGLRPLQQSPRPALAPAPSAGRRAPIPVRPKATPQAVTRTPLRVPPAPLPVTTPSPRPAVSQGRVPSSGAGPSSTPFPSLLESLPPGTIRPLPGERLPGSPVPLSPGAAPSSPLQGMPPPPPPPKAVPPPPWADPAASRRSREVPWGWLLLGLGAGAFSVFLAQGRSQRGRAEGSPERLGIRIVARPDPGLQSLQPQPSLKQASGQE